MVVDSLAVTDQQVLRLEAPERTRGPEAEEGVHSRRLRAGAEEGDRAERVGNDEDAPLLPPQRHLAPPAKPHHRAELERGSRKLPWHHVVRHAEPLRDGGAVPVVPVEQLHDGRRLAELADAIVEARIVDDVEEPDASGDGEGVRGAPARLVLDPAEPVRELVDDVQAASRRAKACSNTSSGCAPSTSSLRSRTNAGTAFAPNDTACRVESRTRSR